METRLSSFDKEKRFLMKKIRVDVRNKWDLLSAFDTMIDIIQI